MASDGIMHRSGVKCSFIDFVYLLRTDTISFVQDAPDLVLKINKHTRIHTHAYTPKRTQTIHTNTHTHTHTHREREREREREKERENLW